MTVYTLGTPSGGVPPSPQFMVSASDKNIWVTDANNDAVFRVVGTGATKGTSTSTILPQGPSAFLQGITEGFNNKLYTGAADAFDTGAPAASPTFTSIPLPALGSFPYILARGKGKIYFNDFTWNGLGIYDTASGSIVILPLLDPTGANGAGGLVVDSTGSPWVACTLASNEACIERVKLTSTWQVFPSTSITVGSATLIGIGETGSSGPFTVKSSNTSVCTANVITGFRHNIQVNPGSAGSCTLTITDAHARSVNVAVTVP